MDKPLIPQKAPYVQPAEATSYWWCACGKSSQQPFCDGSHKGTSLSPLKVDLPKAGNVAWCGCKHSHNGAFCDGSHRGLS